MEISDWRQKIDELDEQIVRLISQRGRGGACYRELKKKSELPVYEPKREQVVFEHIRRVKSGTAGRCGDIACV